LVAMTLAAVFGPSLTRRFFPPKKKGE